MRTKITTRIALQTFLNTKRNFKNQKNKEKTLCTERNVTTITILMSLILDKII